MSATDTTTNGDLSGEATATQHRARWITLLASVLGVAFGFVVTFGFMTLHAPLPQALPAQLHEGATTVTVPAACATGDEVYYATLNAPDPAQVIDIKTGKLSTGKLIVKATAPNVLSADVITVKATSPEGKAVALTMLYAWNSAPSGPNATAKMAVWRYVTSPNKGSVTANATKEVPFTGNTLLFVCAASGAR